MSEAYVHPMDADAAAKGEIQLEAPVTPEGTVVTPDVTTVTPDVTTGDDVDVVAELLDLEAEHKSKDGKLGDKWLAPWFVQKVIEFRARREAAKAAYESVMAQVEREERHLCKKWGETFKGQVEQDLPKRGKTVTYPTGKAGLRKKPDRLEISDEQAAINWLESKFMDEYVKKNVTGKTKLRKLLANGEVIPGLDVVFGTHGVHVDGKVIDLDGGDPGLGQYEPRPNLTAEDHERLMADEET